MMQELTLALDKPYRRTSDFDRHSATASQSHETMEATAWFMISSLCERQTDRDCLFQHVARTLQESVDLLYSLSA